MFLVGPSEQQIIVSHQKGHGYKLDCDNRIYSKCLETRQGRPSTDEAPPIGKMHPFSKMAVTFEPLMRF